MKPCVAYCIPSGDVWKADTSVAFGGLCAYSAAKGITSCFPSILNIRTCSVAYSRNELVTSARALEYERVTHLLHIDSDMHFPPHGLEKLLANDKDVVGVFYPQKAPPYATVGCPSNMDDLSKGGLAPAKILGGGFTLVKAEVYDRIAYPWYEERQPQPPAGLITDDVAFSWKCQAASVEMWADLDLSREMGHSGNNLVRFQ